MANQPEPISEQPSPDLKQRPTARKIFQGVANNARDELGRSTPALFISGLAGGFNMGLTGLGVAIAQVHLGPGKAAEPLAMLFYPLGFVAVIIGRAQLFTENTLYPVALVLDERQHLLNTLRLWLTVFLANLVGASAFAALAAATPALAPEHRASLVQLGLTALQGASPHLFWSGVIGGWIIALVAWMVTASQHTIGQFVLIYLFTFLVGLGHFSHCIASTCEILTAVLSGAAPLPSYLQWLLPVTLGNITGGIVIVSLLNYGQVAAGETPDN